MNALIIYERKNREFENALLIQHFLEESGHDCKVCQFYESEAFSKPWKCAPDVIFVPHLYSSDAVNRVVARFGKPKKIINLQYEQVLSERWEKLGHHNPKGKAKLYDHICWGPKTVERLKEAGVPELNVHMIGAVQLDLLNGRFINSRKAKNYLATEHGLPKNKKWNLFLSSFTYADISDERLEMNEKVAGIGLTSFRELHTESRNEILKWFETALRSDDLSIFIYRPHPDELNLDCVRELSDKYSNFIIIPNHSAKVWIEASDSIFSWYSTTVVESHYMNKEYAILRPCPLPDSFDSVLLKKGEFVTTEKAFLELYQTKSSSMALRNDDVIDYYANSSNPQLSVELLVELTLLNKKTQELSFTLFEIIPHKFKSFIVLLLNVLIRYDQSYIGKKIFSLGFFDNWRKEIVSQRATDLERFEMNKMIRSKLNESHFDDTESVS